MYMLISNLKNGSMSFSPWRTWKLYHDALPGITTSIFWLIIIKFTFRYHEKAVMLGMVHLKIRWLWTLCSVIRHACNPLKLNLWLPRFLCVEHQALYCLCQTSRNCASWSNDNNYIHIEVFLLDSMLLSIFLQISCHITWCQTRKSPQNIPLCFIVPLWGFSLRNSQHS